MNLILHTLLLFFADGVFGLETDGVKLLSVMEGDSVTLQTCQSDVQKYDKLLWTYGSEHARIAEFNKQNKAKPFLFDSDDERFKNRLEMDFESGSLTIRNIRTNHSGIYNVQMFGKSGSPNRRFNVTVIDVFDPDADELKRVSGQEGGTVTLDAGVKVQKDHLMLWKYAKVTKLCVYNPFHRVPCLSDASVIAKIDGETLQISLDAGENQIFKDRLKMDKMSGSLTITNIRPEHSGFYMLEIINNTGTRHRRFNVTVSAVAESNSHVAWMSCAIVLLLVLSFLCLVFIIKKRSVFLRKVMSSCQSKRQEQKVEPIHKPVGESVTLSSSCCELQTDCVVEWRFEGKPIAKVSRGDNKTCRKTYDGADGKLRDKLELDNKTGSLTIKNLETNNYGDYQLQIVSNGEVKSCKFTVSVADSERTSLMQNSPVG